ncbi:D-alanyl-D-alanine carboxypeptidase family protein [Jiella sp. M17.18]|uniref:D-alanyl-D-alanine carboxypeptidase family protein n=1 Tax=Jiella sp. M17.18 TaxID=3234247 RepID=UPI0034E0564A
MIAKRPRFVFTLAAAVLTAAGACGAFAQPEETKPAIETSAKEAMILDGGTGTILFQKDPDTAFPPASLAKMMTMDIVFEAIRSGQLKLDTEFPVSVNAWRTGGAPSGTSTMFAAVKSSVPVSALIRGAIVQSANDACIILAEGMAGSEEKFAEQMNKRAAELGMTGSHFVNPTGLPADGQHVTVRDLIKLARHIRTTYPDLYKIYAEPSFEWNKILQRNRNPLLSLDIGADGMETGYTEASGYALLGVTDTGGRTTYLAMSGLKTSKDRAEEAKKLLTWANQSFDRENLFKSGERVGYAGVFGGDAGSVPLMAKRSVDILVPHHGEDRIKARIRYNGPLTAPIEAGETVASLDVMLDDRTVLSRDLVAGASVARGSFTDRALGAARELAFGWVRAF